MENSQGRRPNEVAGFGNMNTNYSWPNELTQDIEIPVPRVVRIVRTVRAGLRATAMASTLRTVTSMTKSRESSFQIAEFSIDHPILADARVIKTHDRISLVTGPVQKMAMTNFVSTLCLVLLCSAIFLGSSTLAAAQDSGLDGTYILDETDSDNVNEVIEDAAGKLNFLTRDIARGRLKKLNPAYRQVVITSSPNEISVTVDNQPPLRTPAKGAPVAWVGPDGGKVNASMQLAGRRLAQTFTSADGRRVNDYTLSPDGRTLTMQVTETSPQLSQTITYKQVYRRVS